MLEEITARDENNNICTHGSRVLPTGRLSMDGPPTTFSGTGIDRMAFLQANMTRDNTEFVNGATVGDRCIFQVCCFFKPNRSTLFFFVKVTMVVHSVKKLRLWLFINMIGYNPFVLELVYV